MMEFDRMLDRRNTDCAKWDEMDEKYGRSDLIHLGVADMDFQAPEEIRKDLGKIVSEGVWGYTNTSKAFFKSISEWLERRHGCRTPEEWLVFCPRINVAASVLVEAFSRPGDQVMLHAPYYMPLYQAAARNGREVAASPLRLQNDRYEMDFEDMEKRVTNRTRILFLCSPHNPTTRIWSREELAKLVDFVKRHNLILASDEIHADIRRGGVEFTSILEFEKQLKGRLVLLSSPTKTFNMPGVIVSYMAVPDPGLRIRIQAVIDRWGMHNPTAFSVQALITAYTKCDAWLQELNRYIDGNEKLVRGFLEKEMPGFRVFTREGTYLLWIDLRTLGRSETQLEEWFVEEARTAVYMGGTFGEEGKGFVRLNLGTSRARLTEALERMKEAKQSLYGGKDKEQAQSAGMEE